MAKHYTDDPSIFPATGGCPCGLIRYSILTTPMTVHCCHCTACQREQGSAFAINILIESSNVVLHPPSRPFIPHARGKEEAGEGGGGGGEQRRQICYATPEMCAPSQLGIEPAPASAAAAAAAETGRDDGIDDNGVYYEPVKIATPSQSGKPHNIFHCPRCLASVYSEYPGGGPFIKFIAGGTLDKPWQISPDIHIYTASKRDFVVIDDDNGKRLQFEAFYDTAKHWRPDAVRRLEEVKRKMGAAGSEH